MKSRRFILVLAILPWFARATEVDFVSEVRPVLSDACYHCHGPDANARKAKLRLDDRDSALAADVFDSGEMLDRLTTDDPDLRMPPPNSKRTLRPENRSKLVRWLKQGANWPEDDRHWAFIPPSRPELPKVKRGDWPENGIDHFVLARLEREGLEPSPEADRATLLRRVTYDLTGLPPALEELDAFLADDSADAYEKAVDRLLSSPRYGEHMALDWLEASRYADTDGYQNDRLRYMWVWRDWLIRALNENIPFDQFVTEQMAGDLLPDRNFMTQVATGFNRNHRINSEGGSIPDEWIVEYVADRVETAGTMFLGLTLTCARCHDHKYDPVSQKDFYQLFAFFNNIAEAGLGPNNGNSPPFIPVPKSWPNLSEAEMAFVVPEPPKVKLQQTSVPRPQPGKDNTVMVLHELDTPRETYVLQRGLYDQPDKSERLQPGTPAVLGAWNEAWPRNRLGFARWLMDPAHPLTARVTVNRFWQHHFRPRAGENERKFRRSGRNAEPSGVARLARDGIHPQWLERAGNAPAHRHQRGLPPKLSREPNVATTRSRKPAPRARSATPAFALPTARRSALRQRLARGKNRRPIGKALHAAGHLEEHFQRYLQGGQGQQPLPSQPLHLLAPHGSASDDDGVQRRGAGDLHRAFGADLDAAPSADDDEQHRVRRSRAALGGAGFARG